MKQFFTKSLLAGLIAAIVAILVYELFGYTAAICLSNLFYIRYWSDKFKNK
jgi:hypothetical protein